MLKMTWIGSICEIVVSSVFCASTRLPSDFSARLVTPLIGASTRVYCRLRRGLRERGVARP